MAYSIRMGHKCDMFFVTVPANSNIVGAADYSIVRVFYSKLSASDWVTEVKANRIDILED